MEKERYFLHNKGKFIGQVYKRDNRQIVAISGKVDLNDDIGIFSNLTGKLQDKELISSIVDCLRIDRENLVSSSSEG